MGVKTMLKRLIEKLTRRKPPEPTLPPLTDVEKRLLAQRKRRIEEMQRSRRQVAHV